MAVSLMMDAVVAILLIATIVFAVKLNGRLAALRNDSARLQGLIQGLRESSSAAEDAVAALKLTAGDAGRQLQNTIEQARKLDADLNFITERAGAVANRLEIGMRAQRDQQPPATVGVTGLSAAQQAAASAAAAAAVDGKGNQSRLAMLLKQAEAAEAPSSRIEPSLERNAARPKPRPTPQAREDSVRPPEPREAPRAAEPQSRAERELLRALEARSRQ